MENCRIRTAFTLDNGDKVYLEMSGIETSKHTPKHYKRFKNYAVIDHCHYIFESYDDENGSKVFNGYGISVERNGITFEYTHKGILEFVNSLGASYDEVVILPDLAGYRVHHHGGGYNLADDFVYNKERTEQAQRIKQYYYDKEKEKGVRFPCFSIWFQNVQESETLLVRFFDERGTTEIADVFAFDFK